MYSIGDRKKAIDLYVKNGYRATRTVRELGYPTRQTLLIWYQEYQKAGGENGLRPKQRHYNDEDKQRAVDHYLDDGRCFAHTIRVLGYPTKKHLRAWVNELAPQERIEKRRPVKDKPTTSFNQRTAAVVDLCFRSGSAQRVASQCGTTRPQLYQWKNQLLGRDRREVGMNSDNDPMDCDDSDVLTSRVDELRREIADLHSERHRLRLENDILEAMEKVRKKEIGIDPVLASNADKTLVIDALKTIYPLKELVGRMEMAKSSYFYQKTVMAAPDKYEHLRAQVRDVFAASGSTYGYRRVRAVLIRNGIVVSEKVIRQIMASENLVVPRKKTTKYKSYIGEISPAVSNIIERDFHAEAPNEKWLTDLSEFHIPAGKVYLSPVVDCFDGMAVAWSIGAHPNADLVNTMLDDAVATLGDGEHPVVHTDRGCHYRWPDWIKKMTDAGLTRSMSKKGCSPDNAACEGFFGRLKNEMFHGRSWVGVSIAEFIVHLDAYLHWYNHSRIKLSLNAMSPVEYRRSLGLIS